MTDAISIAMTPPPPLHDFSPWGMFVSADIVVQAVMLGLVAASITVWSIGAAKAWEIRKGKRRARALHQALRVSKTLAEAEARAATIRSFEYPFIAAAVSELSQSVGLPPNGVKERIAVRLHRLEAGHAREIAAHVGVLATVGAIAPFVGLFGTVWGIMNGFIGIAKAKTTSLAVVAPGIAEALLATALGLMAAIPAVVIYNALTRGVASYRAALTDVSSEVICLAGRDLDRGDDVLRRAAE